MRMPPIVTPVSRFLAVEDPQRAAAFYRDVLGFQVLPPAREAGVPSLADLVSGPARLQLVAGPTALDSAGASRTAGAAIVFFETADVDATRAAVLARGGAPTDIERVNWIKMRMFQLRDPDGHTLWFGQSFHESYATQRIPAGSGRLRRFLPELPLDDVAAGVAYYRDVLGFRINYQQADLGVMDRDSVTLLLIARTPRHTGIGSCGAYIDDADALHTELVARGARVQGEPVSHPWGLRSFQVLDLEGNRLTFSQTFE